MEFVLEICFIIQNEYEIKNIYFLILLTTSSNTNTNKQKCEIFYILKNK